MQPRKNKLENDTQNVINSVLDIELLYQDNNSSDAIELIKQSNLRTKLFLDACSENRTNFGNQMKTEFVIHAPKHNINWRVECKSQVKDTDLIYRVYKDLSCVVNFKESLFFLVLDGAFLKPYNLLKLANIIMSLGIEDRVLYGSLTDFERALKNQMV